LWDRADSLLRAAPPSDPTPQHTATPTIKTRMPGTVDPRSHHEGERRAVLLGEACGDPDDGDGLKARRIGQKLPEMIVIGALQLVLDQNPAVGVNVLAENVGTKRANGFFLRFQFEVDAERLAQHGDVLRPREPWGKTGSLADPDVAKVDTFEAS
jgi:hypothetical protein